MADDSNASEPESPVLADPVLGSAAYLLLKAGHYFRIEFENGLAAMGLSARELLVLSFVATTEGLSQQELSGRLGLDPTIVVGLVDGLEDGELLQRSRDPEDRRRNVLSLTKKGRAMRKRAEAAVAQIEAEFFASLDDERRSELRSILRDILVPRLSWLS